MKTFISTLLLAATLPAALLAQPTISKNEFYTIGDVIQMVNCSTAGITAGAPGAGMTWDFSRLTTTGTSTMSVAKDTSSIFLTSNIMITLPNGFVEYVQENNTDSWVNGILEPATGLTTYYNNYDQSKRPVTYLTAYADTYRVTIPTTGTTGTGFEYETGDAYGTLILPTGTYTNVLRIKKVQTETDTTGSSVSAVNTTISYLWFDTSHSEPLFRIDSLTTLSNTTNTASFLAGPLVIKNISNTQSSYTGYLDNSTLAVFGSFDNSTPYEVTVYNMVGMKIFNEEFIANSNTRRFDIGTEVAPGMYIVSIASKNDAAAGSVIKVVKE